MYSLRHDSSRSNIKFDTSQCGNGLPSISPGRQKKFDLDLLLLLLSLLLSEEEEDVLVVVVVVIVAVPPLLIICFSLIVLFLLLYLNFASMDRTKKVEEQEQEERVAHCLTFFFAEMKSLTEKEM